ncbi:MAG: hypothetical protein IPL61_39150 [Myxococcales bacterium]|nr:hypothetical protein [Myxococcales bacterium]
MDEPVPALDGKPPAAATRTAAGKRRVAALVMTRAVVTRYAEPSPGFFDWPARARAAGPRGAQDGPGVRRRRGAGAVAPS